MRSQTKSSNFLEDVMDYIVMKPDRRNRIYKLAVLIGCLILLVSFCGVSSATSVPTVIYEEDFESAPYLWATTTNTSPYYQDPLFFSEVEEFPSSGSGQHIWRYTVVCSFPEGVPVNDLYSNESSGYTFGPNPKTITTEFDLFYSIGAINEITLIENGRKLSFCMKNLSSVAISTENDAVQLGTVPRRKWLSVKTILDTGTNTFSLYIDSIAFATGLATTAATAATPLIRFHIAPRADFTIMMVDNLKVSVVQGPPETPAAMPQSGDSSHPLLFLLLTLLFAGILLTVFVSQVKKKHIH